ncbi:3-oxoadipate enol-lactonase [Panacibacter ginsenosidivorans]|uniref:3-oxoadipate enol-lactonase n=1 Tax=Panacibacter ginsenosidivorans TaxID=1813871 RepID=A0A5B8V6V5_9BACT|nr:3-oxoadipate enol-lactonase [Panacibacter ginsenosidivorans]QEC66855.1 3-oxoadipate enol-lactonase [Panacibacter ginsenosidivorans]
MQFVSINGHTIHYKHIISTANETSTFLFVNSLGTDFRIWDEVVESLKEYGNIILFDKRGHGLSDVFTNTTGLNDFADDAAALLNYLHINKFIIVGLSVGGMIAQILASRFPTQIEKLILCDTRYKIGNEDIWNTRIHQVKEQGLESISEGVIQRWFSADFHRTQAVKVTGYQNMLERTPALGYIQACEAIRDADLTAIAKQIKTPTLCIVGSEDKSTTPEEVKYLADLIEGAAYKIIKGSGHIPCIDNPSVLSKLIIDFIK